MENYGLIIILIWLVSLASCAPSRKRGESREKFHEGRGEALAVDYLIQQYEKEHQQLHVQETINGYNLGWPVLENKDLSNYCRKYIQQIVPSRKNEGAIGVKIETTLHYGKEITSIISRVEVVRCKVSLRSHQRCYYMTRAPEPNCVYALNHPRMEFIFTIINKHCGFEDKPLINSSLKRKSMEIASKTHPKTGQPIAKDEYLLDYELEHQKLLKCEGENGIYIKWPHVMDHSNLDSLCYQYLKACAPRRNLGNVTGTWRIQRLHYQKSKTIKDIDVATVTCMIPNATILHYHITRAFETNCVYALLRLGYNIVSPLVIIYKHCDFEHPNDELITSQN